MLDNTRLTFADLQALFGFGCLIGSVAFAIATRLKEAEIKNMKSETLKEVRQVIDKFRDEMKSDLHYFRQESDQGARQFELNVQKSLSNYKVKVGNLQGIVNEVIDFLIEKLSFKKRRERLNEDSLPTDFTTPKSRDV